MIKDIERDGLIAILRNIPKDKLKNILDIFCDEGLKFVEVTLNSPDAFESIEMASRDYKDRLHVGAGTVNTLDDLKRARGAGAKFFLTPGINEEVLEYSRDNNLCLIPGFYTASEAMKAMEYGFKCLKLFPAGGLPKGYLRAVHGPLNGVKAIAVGGVNLENIGEFLEAGYCGVGIGGNIVPKDLVENNDWESLREVVRSFRKKVVR